MIKVEYFSSGSGDPEGIMKVNKQINTWMCTLIGKNLTITAIVWSRDDENMVWNIEIYYHDNEVEK